MNDIAHKVTERLYGDDKIKCEFISCYLNITEKMFDILGCRERERNEFTKSLSEGRLDEYIMGLVEFYEENFDLEKVINNFCECDINCIPTSVIKKVDEIFEDENLLHVEDLEKLDNDSAKKVFKRLVTLK